jgi:iron(III) transport system ATP-binding protein
MFVCGLGFDICDSGFYDFFKWQHSYDQMTMAAVRLQHLTKTFGDAVAVRDLSVEIKDGEFFSILGPSGCGKTTTLRLIAGFDAPTSGSIYFDEQEVTTLRPNQRNTGMVFQNYALFPHMTVRENVAFGLRARRMEAEKIQARVKETLALVEMQDYLDRPVTQLSGGQQQRVALARALAVQPSILLLDEPLSNLDAQLRRSTRHELKSLQRRLGITAIYVTHDQEEAFSLSDRILVMHRGAAQQIGAPEEIYFSPASSFVMSFIGHCNFLEGRISEINDKLIWVRCDSWKLSVLSSTARGEFKQGDAVIVAFRPHDVTLHAEAGRRKNPVSVQLQFAEFAGGYWDATFLLGGHLCRAHLSPEAAHALELHLPFNEKRLWMTVPQEKIIIFGE